MKGGATHRAAAASKLPALFRSLQQPTEGPDPKAARFVASVPCGGTPGQSRPPTAIQPNSEIPELWRLQRVQRRFIKALHGVAARVAAGAR